MAQPQKCPDCGGTAFVEDHAQGDIVCKGCGLVVESHIIDERSEWRTFSDKDKESTDPNRVGGPGNPLLEGGGLSTVIGKVQGRDAFGGISSLGSLHMRSNNPDRNLMSAFKKISTMCEQLAVVSTIKDRACELYKEAMETGMMKGKGMQAVAAGCLYLACRQENNPRTFREITAVLPPEVQKRDIGRCFKDIVQAFKDKAAEKGDGGRLATFVPNIQHPADYIMRFTSELKLEHKVRRACHDMALNANPKHSNGVKQAWDAKSPLSIAGAIIYIVTLLSKDPKDRISIYDISSVSGMAEVTIKGAYRDIYPEVARLLPKGYATEEAIRALPPPVLRDGTH